jgi:lantibiotic biosynthesis dehydratase-like protein
VQTSVLEAASLGVASHLVGIPHTQWALWRCICLRSAGFSTGNIQKLAAPPEIGEAADLVESALRATDLAFEKARLQINSALDDLKQSGHWKDNRRRAPLLKAKRKLEAKQLPGYSLEIDALGSVKELRACLEHMDAARESFKNAFSEFSVHVSQVISDIADCPRFREAVTWQNRKLVTETLDGLRHRPPRTRERTSRLRQHEELIATYLQRYCMKGDTIGFFGPVGWGKFVADGERLRSIPGKRVVTARQTYWEVWAIEKLSSVIAQNPGVLPWVPPITMPFIRMEGATLHHPVLGPRQLTPAQAAIVQSCNGRDPANEIAEKMLRLPEGYFNSEAEVYACLKELADKGIIFWAINIPSGPHPEQALRTALEGIGDVDVRRSSLDMLDQLDTAKQHVAAAAGDGEKLGASLHHLEELFTRLTASAATRHPGKSYAGRTLVYEDCRRDLEISAGPGLFQELVAPLSLLLTSARWITAELRKIYRKKFLEIFAELAGTTGQSSIDAALFWTRAMPFLVNAGFALNSPVQEEFQARWDRILRLGQEPGPVNYSSADLRERVLAEFPAAQAGWTGARYHSPDIMIAAASEDAIRKGEYCFVLGELHVSMNTLSASLFVNQHPSQEELLRAVEHDLGALNLVPVVPISKEMGSRMALALIAPSNLRLEYAENAFVTDRSRVLPVSSLLIESEGGQLVAKTRDGRFHVDAMDLVGVPLRALVMNSFRMMAPQSHSPRVSIDRLVIKRESWRSTVSELAFARESKAADRYAQARKWRKSHAMPRFVFFKAPAEPKPCYLDFESPILVDIFCKMVRRSQESGPSGAIIEISEMLPTPDQIWLTDAENNRYVSELRMVAVDLQR